MGSRDTAPAIENDASSFPDLEREPGVRLLVDYQVIFSGSIGGDVVQELRRTREIIPEGTKQIRATLSTSSPMAQTFFGHRLTTEAEIQWLPVEEGTAVIPIGPGTTEAAGAAWVFFVRVVTLESVFTVARDLTVRVEAHGEYPRWSGSPYAAADWSDYRAAIHAGVPAVPPRIEDRGAAGSAAVIAVIDTGTNPFHSFFRRADPGAVIEARDEVAGTPALLVEFPDEDARMRWPQVALEPRALYRFAGTRQYFYSLLDEVDSLDYVGHGTAVAGAALLQAPDAVIVNVQVSSASLADGILWAAKQPWIDIISISWSCYWNCISSYPLHALSPDPQTDAIAGASRLAWSNGKLVVAAIGNDPTPGGTDAVDSPPWVIEVGGADPGRKGEITLASKTPEFLSDFLVKVPTHTGTSGMRSGQGTSFSAPTVSGTLAQAISELRTTADHEGRIRDGALVRGDHHSITNRELRDALNRTAVYWDPLDYEPSPPEDPLPSIPILPVAPWLQMGWGYANASSVPAMVAGLLGGEPLPAKPAAAGLYMQARQETRERLWP